MGKKIITALKQNGYKITPSRRLLVSIIAESNEHLTPAAIFARVKSEDPGISLVTIYRTLEILTKLGFICEVHGGGNCRSYLVKCPVEHHHHLICSGCGRVTDFTGCDLSSLEGKLSRKTGFQIDSHLLEFLGLCSNCQRKTVS